MILETSRVKSLFLEVIAKAKKRYVFTVDNFCVMENHFHMILCPGPGENLSRIMQWILSVFAMAYNRLYRLTGHVWGERFFSVAIVSFYQFLHANDYIDKNPVKAGLVRFLQDWYYCGLSHRRRGLFEVLDPLSPLLSLILPAHTILMLEAAKG
jgi:putative transposase